MHKKVFQLLVDNTSGVLSRISGLFSRRGYNIESITAGVTADPRLQGSPLSLQGMMRFWIRLKNRSPSSWMSAM